MDFWKFEEWLAKGAMRFTRCDQFDKLDPLDGRFSPGNQSRLSKSEAAFASAYRINDAFDDRFRQNEVTRGCVFISCWNIGRKESARMWLEYTASAKAVAVVSSVGKLQRSLPKEVTLSRVKYVPDSFPRSLLSHLTVYFYKSPQFAYENELRLLRPLLEHESVFQDDPKDFGRSVPVRLHKVIGQVIAHPDADEQTFKEISKVLVKALPNAYVRRSALPPQKPWKRHEILLRPTRQDD
jgi:hypothetical protein